MEVSQEVLFLLPWIGVDEVIREGFMEEGYLSGILKGNRSSETGEIPGKPRC